MDKRFEIQLPESYHELVALRRRLGAEIQDIQSQLQERSESVDFLDGEDYERFLIWRKRTNQAKVVRIHQLGYVKTRLAKVHQSRKKNTPSMNEDAFWAVLRSEETDFVPFGEKVRPPDAKDCRSGCVFFQQVSGVWGICCSVQSPRKGLLTHHNQGCSCYAGKDESSQDRA